MLIHTIEPVYDARSRVLILGSFPSVKSREDGFFYAHKQNRFWKVLAAVCGEAVPQSVTEKKALLLRQHIALWDVVRSCDVSGSADSSIRDAVPNDLHRILDAAPIERICCNGKKAYELYCRLSREATGLDAVCLPSTSPANAAWSLERLIQAYRIILSQR